MKFTRSEGSRAVEAYWRSICPPEGGVPHKDALNPAQIKAYLPNILLMEVHEQPERKLIVRLAGTALRDLWHIEPTGHDYMNFLPLAEKDEVFEGFLKVAHHPCGRWRQVISNFAEGGSLRVETSLFPLHNSKGKEPIILVFVELLTHTHELERRGPTHFASFPARAEWIDLGFGTPDGGGQ